MSFKVGLSGRYKPGADEVRELIRKHGLVGKDAEDQFKMQEWLAAQQTKAQEWGSDEENPVQDSTPALEEEVVVDPNRFDRFSLSSSLESLMDQSFLKLVQIRRKFGLGWAGAELLHAETEKTQIAEADVLASKLKVSIPLLESLKTQLFFPRKSRLLIGRKVC
jgi:ubiquitin-conjugating enzyme E2 Q